MASASAAKTANAKQSRVARRKNPGGMDAETAIGAVAMLRSVQLGRGDHCMHPVLRLWEDVLSTDCAFELPPMARMVFVVHGAASVGGKAIGDGEAWHGEGAVTVASGPEGTTCWRWEL